MGGHRVDVKIKKKNLAGSGWGGGGKFKKKKWGGGGRGRGPVWGVRVDVIQELKSFWENSQKKKLRGGGGAVWGRGGQGGCD